jgi:hypothetical protein
MQTYLLVSLTFRQQRMSAALQPGSIICAFDCPPLDAKQKTRLTDALGCVDAELLTPAEHRNQYPDAQSYSP